MIVAQSLHDFQYRIVNATHMTYQRVLVGMKPLIYKKWDTFFVKTHEIQRDSESFEWSFRDFNKDEFLFVVRWDWQMYYKKICWKIIRNIILFNYLIECIKWRKLQNIRFVWHLGKWVSALSLIIFQSSTVLKICLQH